jgi:hypothetical protein
VPFVYLGFPRKDLQTCEIRDLGKDYKIKQRHFMEPFPFLTHFVGLYRSHLAPPPTHRETTRRVDWTLSDHSSRIIQSEGRFVEKKHERVKK